VSTEPLEHNGSGLCDPWEAAYSRFETKAEEIKKFRDRLRKLGAAQWPRDSEIVELFCGRGNGLHALEGLGFTRLEGADLSPTLLAQYTGTARCYVCDCRQLPFEDASKHVLIVQGGLHHLPVLPDDLERCFSEMRRVVRANGCVVFVEPWLTPFLSLVHGVCRSSVSRRLSGKIDALATMIEHEKVTYEQWLGNPNLVLQLSSKYFHVKHQSFAWGKWCFVGGPRSRMEAL
jgi:ubiquinone/menaquinone biosynthesis C-methylase UbiE